MKKLLLLSLVALATMFASCSGVDMNDPNPYCWKVVLPYPDEVFVSYFYGTRSEVEAEVNYYKQYGIAAQYSEISDYYCDHSLK